MTATTQSSVRPSRSRAGGRLPGAGAAPRTGRVSVRHLAAMALLFLFTVYFLLPVYWVAVASTKSAGDLFGSFGLWFADPQWTENLARTFSQNGGIYARWLVNSVIYAGIGSLGATLISAAAGYALCKYRFRGREVLFSGILAGVMVPQTVLALPLYLMMSAVGMNNSYLSVLLPSMVSPFGVYLARIYAAASIPDELIEAARIDGAGESRIFFTIALRIMTPALVTIFLFQLVAIWNNFFLPLVMLSDQELYPIVLGLTLWNSQMTEYPGIVELTVTGAFVSVVIVVGAVISLQRFWKAGLTSGSLQ